LETGQDVLIGNVCRKGEAAQNSSVVISCFK
jgi:hypothetical protein